MTIPELRAEIERLYGLRDVTWFFGDVHEIAPEIDAGRMTGVRVLGTLRGSTLFQHGYAVSAGTTTTDGRSVEEHLTEALLMNARTVAAAIEEDRKTAGGMGDVVTFTSKHQGAGSDVLSVEDPDEPPLTYGFRSTS